MQQRAMNKNCQSIENKSAECVFLGSTPILNFTQNSGTIAEEGVERLQELGEEVHEHNGKRALQALETLLI